MKAFLSHSSGNKALVREVYDNLGGANAEFDEQTFSAGTFNTEAIRRGVERSNVFVLFATPQSLQSGYVEYEINVAAEYLASKRIARILTFCLDGVSPENLPLAIRQISAVRRSVSAGAAARQIRASLIELDISLSKSPKPYLGRDKINQEIKYRLAAPDETTPIAIAFSGIDGIGRRTLATRVLADVYPGVSAVPPFIKAAANMDVRDLYRGLVDVLGGKSKSEIFEAISAFEKLSDASRLDAVVENIQTINGDGEVIYVVDDGGVLNDDGSLSVTFKKVVDLLKKKRSGIPFIVFILFRTPPLAAREAEDVVYFRVDPIEPIDIQHLISLHIKRKGQLASKEDVARLVEMTDGHPYNLQFVLRLLDTHTLQSLLQDPSDLVAFKRRQGDDFVNRINLDDNHLQVLGILRALGQSSIELIASSLSLPADVLAKSIRELEEYHCIERVGDLCSLNRPLRSAFERSSMINLRADKIETIQSSVIELFKSYKNEDQISVDIISAAARAAAFLNKDDEALKIFLTPANSIMVAKQLYDLRRFSDCARACKRPLLSPTLISKTAKTEAIRLRCLSLARLGDQETFDETIKMLGTETRGEIALKPFLEGFRFRLNGDPERAVEQFRNSYKYNPTSFSLLRELSYCLMQIGEAEEARGFAEQALAIAPSNPYVIDLVLSLRLSERHKLSRDVIYDPDIEELLDGLQQYGDEDGKSFFAIRMADIYRRAGDLHDALQSAQRACDLTPSLVPAHSMEAEILIRLGNLPAAKKKIDLVQRLVEDKSTGEAKTRLPEYILLKVDYLTENGEIEDAANLLRSNERRLRRRVPELKRKIAFHAHSSGMPIREELRLWLK